MSKPTPLPMHVISLALQYLLPPSPPLPTHLITKPLLARHHFLSLDGSSDAAAYFCWPGADDASTKLVIHALEEFTVSWAQSQESEFELLNNNTLYEVDASSSVKGRVKIGEKVELVFLYEGPVEGWKYHDAVLVSSTRQALPLHHSLEEALESSGSGLGLDLRNVNGIANGVHSNERAASPTNSDAYWGGYGSSPPSPHIHEPASHPHESAEDSYWAAYGAIHGSGDSTVPSPAPNKSRARSYFEDVHVAQIVDLGSRPTSPIQIHGRSLEVPRSHSPSIPIPPVPNVVEPEMSSVDKGLVGAVKGLYEMWNSGGGGDEAQRKKAFLALVERALDDD